MSENTFQYERKYEKGQRTFEAYATAGNLLENRKWEDLAANERADWAAREAGDPMHRLAQAQERTNEILQRILNAMEG